MADAIAKIGSFDPHAVITDLNFGITGPSGADLLQHIEKEHPLGWQGGLNLTCLTCPSSSEWNGSSCWCDLTS